MKHKFLFLILLLVCIFSCPILVRADKKSSDSYVECWYNNIYFYYNVTSDEYSYYMNTEFSDFSTSLKKSNFIDKKTNNLYCPSIYTSLTTKNSRRGNIDAHISKENDTDTKLDPTKKNLVNPEINDKVSCVYTSNGGENSIEYILDTKKNIISSVQVNGINAASNVFKYSEIYSGGKCVKISEIYTSCYDGSRGGESSCSVIREKPSAGTGISSSQTELDESTSTAGEETVGEKNIAASEITDPCEVIPEDIRNWIYWILDLIKYIALVLVVILSVLDFIKAAAEGKDDSNKKAFGKLIKRVIVVVILFLLPVLIELILKILSIPGVVNNNTLCK